MVSWTGWVLEFGSASVREVNSSISPAASGRKTTSVIGTGPFGSFAPRSAPRGRPSGVGARECRCHRAHLLPRSRACGHRSDTGDRAPHDRCVRSPHWSRGLLPTAGTIVIVTDPIAALARAEEIAETVFFPAALDVDLTDTVPKSHLDRLAAEGFYALAGPPEYGGLTKERAADELAPFSRIVE